MPSVRGWRLPQLQHIYAQVIDDTAGRTLASASTLDKELSKAIKYGGNKAPPPRSARRSPSGRWRPASRKVAFDRREYKYHGRVAALADAAREAGLEF